MTTTTKSRWFARWIRPLGAAALGCAMLLTPAALAGPAEPKHVPADAKWYIHLDVDAVKQTDVFKEVLDAVKIQFPVDDVVAQLKAAIGVNPLTDINGITIYNTTFEKDVAAILIYAKVDKGLLLQAIAQNPDYKDHDYGKHVVNTWTDQNDGKKKAGCFYGDGLVIMGDKIETVQSAIDVLDGKKSAGSALMKAPAKGAFLYASADLAQSDDKNLSRLLSNSEAATAWAGETDGKFVLNLNVTAKTAEQAAQVKQLLSGVQAFAALGAQDTPTAAALVQKVEIVKDGAKIIATFQHDAKTLLQTLQKLDEENKAKAAKKPAAGGL